MLNREIPFRPRLEGDFRIRFYNAVSRITENTTLADIESIADEEIYRKIITGKLEFNEGMIIENIVAQMLRSTGHKLYFFSFYDKGSSADTMEIDFLIAKKTVTSRRNISPIEVKSGKNYTLSSMNKFRSKFREYAGQPYVIHTLDYAEKDGIIYLPLYMTYFL